MIRDVRRMGREAVGLAALLLIPSIAWSQGNREQRVTRAFGEFDADRRLQLLVPAVNPQTGPQDSVWSVSVQLIAQTLLEEQRRTSAEAWLRWATRLQPDFRVDTLLFLPEIASAQRSARRFVEATRGDAGDVASTSWRWPSRYTDTETGWIRVSVPSSLDANVRIEPMGAVEPGVAMRVPPGSYEIEASLEGRETARVTREVLPGVTTDVELSLRPTLSDEIASRVTRSVVKLVPAGPSPRCRNAFAVGSSGMLLTSYGAISGLEELAVVTSDGRRTETGVQVAAYDTERDVAVLSVPFTWSDSLIPAPAYDASATAWLAHYPECGTPTITSVETPAWRNRPRGRLEAVEAFPLSAAGAPVFDAEGRVFGLVRGPAAAIPMDHAASVLAEARANVDEGRLLSLEQVAERQAGLAQAGDGKFPWTWAALGAVGAGAVIGAVLATGGGDGDGDGDGPTTGGIIITLPGQ